MIVIDEISAPAPPRPRRRRRWRLLLSLALVVVLVAASTVTALSVSFHYLHAQPLEIDGGGWIAPVNASGRQTTAGSVLASTLDVHPGQVVTFQVTGYNFSPVTQTILGLADAATLADPRFTGEPETLTMAPGWPDQSSGSRFSRGPLTVRPHQSFTLDFTVRTTTLKGQRCEWWNELRLRVRVGAFTRTENVQFAGGNVVLEIAEGGASC